MKKGFLFLLSILFILPIIFVLSSESIAQVLEEKMVVVKGTDDWKNTRIRLYPNDKVTIRAAGEVCFSHGEQHSCVNADGYPREDYLADYLQLDFAYCGDPMENVDHAALIGNVGSDDFFIGKNSNFTGKDGFLYLGINDCSLTGGQGTYYNTGQFEVFISVKHIK
jgi:hypothetical protein